MIVVKIKTWNELAEQYGIDEDGDIVIEDKKIQYTNFFTKDMELNMPKNRIIKVVTTKDGVYLWSGHHSYTILEEFIEEKYNLTEHPQYFI